MSKPRHKQNQNIRIASPEEVQRYTGRGDAQTSKAATEVEPESPADAPQAEAKADDSPVDELAALRKQVEELTDKHLRAVAEHQNYMRRAAAEQAEVLRYGGADRVKALLTVVDDIERTLQAVPENESSSLAEGVRLIHDKLIKTLADHHVERITAVGEPFDPACHEAVMQKPSEDHPPGTVLQEYQSGYRLWDRVLRPAKVIVSAAPAETAENDAVDRRQESD